MSEVVMMDAPELVKKISKDAWVTPSGRTYWDERTARYDACTHVTCECGTVIRRDRTRCDICCAADRNAKYSEMPREQWDGVCGLNLFGSDTYFFELSAIKEYCAENDENPRDLQLVICKKVPYPELELDYFLEDLHEDAELPDEAEDLIEQLNSVLKRSDSNCWEPTNVAAVVDFSCAGGDHADH